MRRAIDGQRPVALPHYMVYDEEDAARRKTRAKDLDCTIMSARAFAVLLFPMSRAIHSRGRRDGCRGPRTERQTPLLAADQMEMHVVRARIIALQQDNFQKGGE